jgi:hypothetical protein
MGDSVPKHPGPISLTDTHPRTEHLPNATDHQRRESPETESLLHQRGSSCLPMQVLWIETDSFLPHR